ncbi:signal peptidase I [Paludibacter sp. 221]|uniref:signal peptidase I n=1 Tax=Paludibacter sp. 221 TaxID=2302939 RepID=UPI0013D829BA|nr:signal peptidase I [Paludibacter sp. 221]
MEQATTAQWVKGIIAVVIYVLFIIWVNNFWWLLLTPFFFDVFVTKYVPWGWWKNIKNKTVRSIMGWVDAIVFALIAVYFIFAFLFQNYQIPTSSLEKTLLVGDFLAVSKAAYGPRVPMTPLSFPLAQHTLPIINTKSYIEKPQWEYRRLKGLTDIKLDDIVVFNFPTGDTVALKMQNPDYYTLCKIYGRERVRNDEQTFGEIVYRPVDRRENYVKRCVGLPGNTFEIRSNQIYVNGVEQPKFPGIQHNYFIQTDGTVLSKDFLKKMEISNEDYEVFPNGMRQDVTAFFGFQQGKPVYHLPLTQETYDKLKRTRGVVKIEIEPAEFGGDVYPLNADYGWNRDNYGPLYIPKKGDELEITLENLPIYERIITTYEKNKLEIKDGVIYINGEQATHYKVKMDYYWMLGDNRHKSADSRYWGFVPEDHVVGRPMFVWLSLDKDKGLFQGKIRWNRFFKNAKR